MNSRPKLSKGKKTLAELEAKAVLDKVQGVLKQALSNGPMTVEELRNSLKDR